MCGVDGDDDDRNEEWFRVGDVAGFSERTNVFDFVSRVRRGGDDDDDDDKYDRYDDDEYVVIHEGCS